MTSAELSQFNQMIRSFYSTCMQMVLGSRIPLLASSFSYCGTSPNGKDFNLFQGDSTICIDKMEPWSKGSWEPMIIDILYSEPGKRSSNSPPILVGSSESEHSLLLERWTIQFSQSSLKNLRKDKRVSKGNPQQSDFCAYRTTIFDRSDADVRARGKPGITVNVPVQVIDMNVRILMRALYSALRLMPAHKLFRDLRATSRCNYSLYYRIYTSPVLENVNNMVHHCFSPIESNFGHMYVSVWYKAIVPIPAKEKEKPLLLSRIISDYVDNASAVQTSSEGWFHASTAEKEYKPTKLAVFNVEEFDCPFAIDEQRTEKNVSGSGAASVVKLLESAAPLCGMCRQHKETFIIYQNKKTIIDALEELKLYLQIRDSLN